jgi:hypothetical protein
MSQQRATGGHLGGVPPTLENSPTQPTANYKAKGFIGPPTPKFSIKGHNKSKIYGPLDRQVGERSENVFTIFSGATY